MEFQIDKKIYTVQVQRKNNKNTYIRINEKLEIVVTTSLFTTNKQVIKILEQNQVSISKMIDKQKKEKEKEDNFYYLGDLYDIIIVPTLERVEIEGHYIYTKDKKMLDSWYQKQMKTVFEQQVKRQYQKFEEEIPFPKIKIRKMKTRWGVCNKKDTSITLNANLMKEKIECLDYVIVHELAHLVYFDHSKAFWNTVSKYCPDYKKIRKSLKE